MFDDDWREICRIYLAAKRYILRAEELDPENDSDWASVIQHRDTLDHLVRVRSVELGIVGKDNADAYMAANVAKAKGHAYRAFFDAADWLGILYRRDLRQIGKQYSLPTLDAVFPEYYAELCPAVARCGKEIAEIRARKDIADNGGRPTERTISEMQMYEQVLAELDRYWDLSQARRPALEQRRRSERVSKAGKIVAWIAGLLLAAFLGWYVPRICERVFGSAARTTTRTTTDRRAAHTTRTAPTPVRENCLRERVGHTA